MKIGFIGLGIMGKPMVKNLMKGGYTDVLVNNRSRAAVDEVVSCGAVAATNEEIGRECDVVMTMLPVMCAYPFLQRYFLKGMRVGAVKG